MQYLGITLDLTRDTNFSEQGLELMDRYYQKDGKEGVQKAIARMANCFSFGDVKLAQFIYDAASKHWFFPSSPILSNAIEGVWLGDYWKTRDTQGFLVWKGAAPKALPIACFLTFVPDSIDGQVKTAAELSRLSVMGGGTAVHSAIRATSDKAPGPIPYFKTVDGIMGYYRQGKTRRGSAALYLDDNHPDVVEFINMRKTSGGDSARKIDNRAGVHCGVNISQAFINAITDDLMWNLVCPHSGEVHEQVRARTLWENILEARELTGEPYLYFIDVANAAFPEAQKALGLKNHGSNLCTEITLATNEERTAVCCLSSVNLERYDEWKGTELIANLTKFLDNVIEWFIHFAPPELERATFSARSERAIGIGAMGFANFLMKNEIPFESGGFNSAAQWNHIIFKGMHAQGIAATQQLAKERGEPTDLIGTGRRNSHLFAIAPNANSSVLCNTTPSIEPLMSNAYTQKSRAGVHLVKNKYLVKWLEDYLQGSSDSEEVKSVFRQRFWKDVVDHNGSVQHINYMPDAMKKVLKTAWEMDQNWIVEHAGERQKYICQAQSTNLFFLPGTDRGYINQVHLKAAREGKVKSLYYFRTGSEGAADTIKKVERKVIEDTVVESSCLSCEG